MKSEVNAESYSEYIGNEIQFSETVNENKLQRFHASLSPYIAPHAIDELPIGFHWCTANDTLPEEALSDDGHIRKGHFLPPIPLPQRMWAGGEIEFFSALKPNAEVFRHSRIDSITAKSGRSGSLVFVVVINEYHCNGALCIRDRQDIVYRDIVSPASRNEPAKRLSTFQVPHSDEMWDLDITPITLFRYSAITFNSHRIHYDEPYATGVEGYKGLVVHGPLQATLMMNLILKQSGRMPRMFSYRGKAPMIAGGECRIGTKRVSANEAECSSFDNTQIFMQARVTW